MRCRIGLDDTDHPDVGCTTYGMDVLLSLVESKIECSIIERNLVRLWPFAERRTRGNGALGATIDLQESHFDQLVMVCREWFSDLLGEINDYPKTDFPASPCLVIAPQKTPEKWYWDSVRGFVDHDLMIEQAIERGCTVLSGESHFGVVGACAAVSWEPREDSSWELIAWREESEIGTQRNVSEKAVSDLEGNHPSTFLNRDPTKGKSMIAPRSPCPVLYGIRGPSQTVVYEAHNWLQSREDVEKCKSFAIHHTNQLSDDHIDSPLSGTITSYAEETRGGHASVSVFSGNHSFELVAFSEGGPVNRLLRKLIPGDRIRWAGLESPDGSIHLERLRLDQASPRIISRPICCSRTMRSAGKGQDLRCSTCGKNEKKSWVSSDIDSLYGQIKGVWTEPSASNRRHLSRPLSLGNPGTK